MLHPTMPPNQDWTSSGKRIEQINAHNLFVFYSCKMLRKDLAQMPLLGSVAEFKIFPTLHQDQSKESSSNEHKGVHLHTLCRSRAEAFEGMWMMESYSS